MPRPVRTAKDDAVSAPRPTTFRSRLLWLAAGLVLGATLLVGVLALPPVQGWLLRRVLSAQTGADLEFTRMRFGPTGASAQELKLRLPDFALEAQALRFAVSPWQLLTRRRLAVDAVEARDLQLTARASGGPSTPFTGLLAQLQAPLDWAVTQAEAEGRFILEQPGAEPLVARFKVSGRELTAQRPGEVAVEFSAPGEVLAGWAGEWKFTGTLAYVPGRDGRLQQADLRGTLQPATSVDYFLPPLACTLRVTATPAGEDYALTLAPAAADIPALTARLDAAFTRATGRVAGEWEFQTGRGLAARVLRRDTSPEVSAQGRGKFSAAATGDDVTAEGEIGFHGAGWDKVAPELAALGAAEGKNTFAVTRRGGTWRLERFDAALAVADSEARVRFTALRPQPLLPFAASAEPWARLEVAGLPLEWARPFLPGVTLTGGVLHGVWLAHTPTAEELRLAPERPVTTGRFEVAHAALPAVQPLELSLAPHLRLTLDQAELELRDLRLAFAQGDFVELNVASVVDYAKLEAKLTVDWTAALPSLLAGPEKPVPFDFAGRVTATASDRAVHLETASLTARQPEIAEPVFTAALLAPVHYHLADERLEAPAEIGTFSVRALPLAWLGRFVPGFALDGAIERGTGVIGLAEGKLTLHTREAWAWRGVTVAQDNVPLVQDSTGQITPAAEVAWPVGDVPFFSATLSLDAQAAEVMQVRDPAGPLRANLVLAGGRDAAGFRLDNALIETRRGDGSPLFELNTVRPMTFKDDAPVSAELPEWFRARLGRVPLELFRAWLAPDEIEGVIEPAEFIGQADWPSAAVKATAPVTVSLRRYAQGGATWLENVTITCEPGIQNSKLVHAAYVENVRATPAGANLGSLGSGYVMYFGDNYTLPVSLVYQTQIDVAQWQEQPVARLFSLPPAGLVTTGYEHDLFNDKQPGFHFSLERVPAPEGGAEPLPALRAKAKLAPASDTTPDEVAMHIEVELETQPRVSKVEFDARLNNRDKSVNVNSTLRGDFVDLAAFERLIATTARTETAAEPAAPAAGNATAATTAAAANASAGGLAEQTSLEYPFWLVIRGRFDLELGEVARPPYLVRDVRGALELSDRTLALRDLSGRTFGGSWGGGLQVDFDREKPAAPYAVEGGFQIRDIDAGAVVAAVYPEQSALFSGRLALNTRVTSTGTHLASLLRNSAGEFDFRADGGRLQLEVPHANLASAALVFGGAVTFSPEIRALGRLIRKFSDLPVEQLRARGHRAPDGRIALDEFRVDTPQLRVSATGVVPAQEKPTFLAHEFELPVTLAAKDEIAVILKGMRLLEKQPGVDGFFALNRRPKLKGTLGNPDTSELFDALAHAADKSTGTFGLLMRKLQREVVKAQAAAEKKSGRGE